jgi:hypothetical protein
MWRRVVWYVGKKRFRRKLLSLFSLFCTEDDFKEILRNVTSRYYHTELHFRELLYRQEYRNVLWAELTGKCALSCEIWVTFWELLYRQEYRSVLWAELTGKCALSCEIWVTLHYMFSAKQSDWLALKMKELWSFETSRTTRAATRRHIPEELKLHRLLILKNFLPTYPKPCNWQLTQF